MGQEFCSQPLDQIFKSRCSQTQFMSDGRSLHQTSCRRMPFISHRRLASASWRAGCTVDSPAELIPCGWDEAGDELGGREKVLTGEGLKTARFGSPLRIPALEDPINLRLNEEVVLFRIICGCPDMTLHAQRLDSPAPFELVAQCFHGDPFGGDATLVHF